MKQFLGWLFRTLLAAIIGFIAVQASIAFVGVEWTLAGVVSSFLVFLVQDP